MMGALKKAQNKSYKKINFETNKYNSSSMTNSPPAMFAKNIKAKIIFNFINVP